MAEIKRQTVFQEEQRLVEESMALSEHASEAELRRQLELITKAYGKLIRQTEKITSVGDSIQRKLVNARLEIAEKNRRLEEAQKNHVHREKMMAMNTLVQGLAHELGNPLNFVTNFASLNVELCKELEALRSSDQPLGEGEVATYLQDIHNGARIIEEQGRRAAAIVDSMGLLFSRQKGTGPIKQNEDINYLLSNFTLSVARRFNHRLGPSFVVEEQYAALPLLKVAMEDLGMVFTQLVTNAVESLLQRQSIEKEFVPLLRLTSLLEDRGVSIFIEDNGVGVSPEIQARIFTPFFSTKNSAANIGLGLSTCFEIIVRGYNGELFQTTLANGMTRFSIHLPIES